MWPTLFLNFMIQYPGKLDLQGLVNNYDNVQLSLCVFFLPFFPPAVTSRKRVGKVLSEVLIV